MQGVANEAEFHGPEATRWERYARGWREGSQEYNGGIAHPLPVKLRRGTVLYRIGHSRHPQFGDTPVSEHVGRAWWMESETLAELSVSANILEEDGGRIDRQWLARMKLAVSEKFGVFDTIICVVVREALGAYRGPGKPVYDWPPTGTPIVRPPPVWAWGDKGVMQLCIPGLCTRADRPTGLAEKALTVLRMVPIGRWVELSTKGIMTI